MANRQAMDGPDSNTSAIADRGCTEKTSDALRRLLGKNHSAMDIRYEQYFTNHIAYNLYALAAFGGSLFFVAYWRTVTDNGACTIQPIHRASTTATSINRNCRNRCTRRK